jgi:hypothetical protein
VWLFVALNGNIGLEQNIEGKMVHTLIYVSTARNKQSKDSLSRLTDQASKRNGTLGVSGLLLYSDGTFMQCLEGYKESVDTLMQSISSDSRHSGLHVLWEGKTSSREFSDWGMAADSPDVGLTQIASSKAIGVWLNRSIDAPKGIARVLLEGFWQRVNVPY